MTTSLPAPALRALLTGCLDYAGLFPPAALELEPALRNYAAYQKGLDSWLLGRFVLPAEKLRAASDLVPTLFSESHPLAVAALLPRSNTAAEFLENLCQGLGEIVGFCQAQSGLVNVEQLEAPLPPNLSPPALRAVLREADDLIENLAKTAIMPFWEIPLLPADHHAIAQAFEGMAEHNNFRRGKRLQPIGLKLRTGGTVAAAFPETSILAFALHSAANEGLTIKFTAGLHHPLRHFNPKLETHMHGFLNVFVAAALARTHRLDATAIQQILEAENPADFHLLPTELGWRDLRISADAIQAVRSVVTSFGCCSFDEPREDLLALGLI